MGMETSCKCPGDARCCVGSLSSDGGSRAVLPGSRVAAWRCWWVNIPGGDGGHRHPLSRAAELEAVGNTWEHPARWAMGAKRREERPESF